MEKNVKMNDNFPLLQVFSGEDRFRRDRSLKQALQQLTEQEGQMGVERLNATQIEPARLATALDTPSLFGGRRVVVLEEAGQLEEGLEEVVLKQIERLRAHDRTDTALLLSTDGHSPGRKITSRADVYEKFPSFRRYKEAISWLRRFAREELDQKLSYKVANEIVNRLGREDAGQLAQEVQKLATLAGPSGISLDTVAQATGQVASVSPYKFYDQVGQRQYPVARKLLDELFQAPGQGGVQLTVGLSIHMTRLARARGQLDQGHTPREVAESFERKWQGEKYVDQSQNWTIEALEQAIQALHTADLELKRGFDKHLTLTLFLSRALLSSQQA